MFDRFKKMLSSMPERPPAPDHEIFAVGDLHGRLDLFRRLLNQILDAATTEKPELIFLGDYIDRGPQSRQLISLLLEKPLQAFFKMHFLKGNHEATLLEFLENPMVGPSWMQFGGTETLLSYGVRPPSFRGDEDGWADTARALRAALPQSHLEFFKNLELSLERGCYFFVHAGVDPEKKIEEQGEAEFLWIRERFLDDTKPLSRIIVHGHTPQHMPSTDYRRIGLDLGGYQSGRIAAARIKGENVSLITASLPA